MYSALGEHQHIPHPEAGRHHLVTLPHGLVHVQNPQLASHTNTLMQYRHLYYQEYITDGFKLQFFLHCC